jgi:hypothetical protein
VLLEITQVTFEKILIAVVSAVISYASAVVTFFATRSKVRLDMTGEYDRALHEKRLELYKRLWPKTEPLGKYASPDSYTYKSVSAVSLEMHDWYFGEGGLFLSKKSRTPYFLLKDAIQRVVEDGQLASTPDQPLPEAIRRTLVEAAGRLRTSLADDIHARNAPWL